MTSDYLWAKFSDDGRWHPLILHMIDVAAVADVVLSREPQATKDRLAGLTGLSWTDARPWILLLVACHDLGKASPGFQLKWGKSRDLLARINITLPRLPDTSIHHAFVSQLLRFIPKYVGMNRINIDRGDVEMGKNIKKQGVVPTDTKIAIFKGRKIRKTIHNNEWWFSVVDVVGILAESENPRDYWYKMKIREKDETGVELLTFCQQLKLEASDGKKYETDCASTEGIFLIIQSQSSVAQIKGYSVTKSLTTGARN